MEKFKNLKKRRKVFAAKLTWITFRISVVFWKSYSNEKWICPTFSLGSELSMYMSTIDTLRFCKLNYEKEENCLMKRHATEETSLNPYSCIIFVLVYCCSTWVALAGARASWRFNLCTCRPLCGELTNENRILIKWKNMIYICFLFLFEIKEHKHKSSQLTSAQNQHFSNLPWREEKHFRDIEMWLIWNIEETER